MACRIDIANAFEDLVAGAWSRVIGTLDVRDVWYLLFGLAFFGLTLAPALSHWRSYNLPAIYVALGMLSSLLELPLISPLGGDIELAIKVIGWINQTTACDDRVVLESFRHHDSFRVGSVLFGDAVN